MSNYPINHFPTLPLLREINKAINADNNVILLRKRSIANVSTICERIELLTEVDIPIIYLT